MNNNLYFKINLFHYYYLSYIIIICLFSKKLNCLENNKYTQSINLLNGNILIIHGTGIVIYDSSGQNLLKYVDNFTNPFTDDSYVSKISISRFSEKNNGYIISTINNYIYIFNWEGDILYHSEKIIQLSGDYYSLIPITKKNNCYIYMIGFLEKNIKNINLLFFSFNGDNLENDIISNYTMNHFSYSFIAETTEYSNFGLEPCGFSCQLMTNSTNENVIVCFINIKGNINNNDRKLLTHFFIDPNNYTIIKSKNRTIEDDSIEVDSIKFIKSAINSDKNKALVCFTHPQPPCYCTTYSIENNSFSEKKDWGIKCGGDKAFELNVYYMRETDQFLVYCPRNGEVTLSIFDEYLNNLYNFTIKAVNEIEGISIIYSYHFNNYYLILSSQYAKSNSSPGNFFVFNSNITINSTHPKIENITEDNNKPYSRSTFLIYSTILISYPYLTSTLIYSSEPSNNISETIIQTSNPDSLSSIIYINSSIISSSLNIPTTETNFESTIIYDETSLFTSYIEIQTSPLETTLDSQLIIYSSFPLSTEIKEKYPFTTIIITNSPSVKLEIIEERIDYNKNEIIDNIKNIIEDIEIGIPYKKVGDDYSILIYPTNIKINLTNITYVDFRECENKLRQYYNISNTTIMTFLQIEIENNDTKSLINQVEYQAYDGNKTLLDLSKCKDINIQVIYSVKNKTLIDIDKVKYFKNSGIDIFNINDSFFNDICEPYSESDNDIILEDRIKYIYRNYSLCEEGCKYDRIDIENLTIICECKVKENISTSIKPINLEYSEKSSTNFDVMKCYNLVFSMNGKINNIGFWIFNILLLIHVPILIYYFSKGIKPIREYIINEMKKYGYIKNNKNNKNNKNIINQKNKSKRKIKNKKNENLLISKNNNKEPPKKKNINKNKKVIIKNLEIIDNSSSLNIIKSTNKEYVSGINFNKKKNISIIENINNNKKLSTKNKINRKKNKNISNLPTEIKNKNEYNIINEKEKNKNLKEYNIINIDLNLYRNKTYIPPDSHIILNNYTFKEAIKYDKRQTCEIFYIFALSKQIFFHTFLFKSPIELFSLRLILFIFILSSDLALNSLF